MLEVGFQFSLWDSRPPLSPFRPRGIRSSLSILSLRFTESLKVAWTSATLHFQFSLWDSSGYSPPCVLDASISFNSLFEIHACFHGSSLEGRLDFQFSLWDSYWWHGAIHPQRDTHLSILSLRFANKECEVGEIHAEMRHPSFNSLFEIRSEKRGCRWILWRYYLSILSLRFKAAAEAQKAHDEALTFNSLFEIQVVERLETSTITGPSFNSLFEIPCCFSGLQALIQGF